jgi:hypothetical protein
MSDDFPKTRSEFNFWLENMRLESKLKRFLASSNDEIDHTERLQRSRLLEEDQEAFPIDPNGPPLFEIKSKDWWFKVVGMLCHNWALIEQTPDNKAIVYFFHDMGKTRQLVPNYEHRTLQKRAGIIDSLEFNSLQDAHDALDWNSFERLEPNPGEWDMYVPPGNYYDARESEEGIYSKGGYWQD